MLGSYTKKTVALLLVVLAAGCAPSVTFRQVQPGGLGSGRDLGLAAGVATVEVSLDLADGRDLAAARKSRAAADGTPSDTEMYGPWIEREIDRNIAASPVSLLTATPTHTIDVAAELFVRDTRELKKEEVLLEKRVVDVKETYELTRVNSLVLAYRVYSRAAGTVVREGKLDGVRSQLGRAANAEDAASQLEPWETVMEKLVVQLVRKMMSALLPRTVTVRRRLREGSTDALREAAKIASREGLDRAGPLWEAMRGRDGSLSPGDRAALFYDLGVYYESKDDPVRAAAAFEQCLDQAADAWCAEGLSRVRQPERDRAR